MVRAKDVQYKGLDGYLAQPDTPTQKGVILLPSQWGVNDRTRWQVDSLAEAGLATLGWNQYTGFEVDPNTPIGEVSARLRDPLALEQMSTWVTYLLEEVGVSSVGAVGFCAGGRFGLILCARDQRVGAFVNYYPTLKSALAPHQEMDAVATASQIRCPVLVVQPGHDHVTPLEQYQALQGQLLARQAVTTFAHYPEATHAFMGVSGAPTEANETACRVSWPQAISFLTAWLG